MKCEEAFRADSFGGCASVDAIKRILCAALDAANPADAVRRSLARDGGLLEVNGQEYALKNFSAIYLVAVGKAAFSMANAATKILGETLTAGIVVSKSAFHDDIDSRLHFLRASHPIPDMRSLAAGEKILELLAKTTADDLVLFLISGGGSALMTVPEKGISLADMEQLTSLLLGCGARIDEINTLRRALDRVKGGGLARAAYPAQTISLILSDVVNSPLEAIASGPTVPNPTTRRDALAILEKYDLISKTPQAIIGFLKEEAISLLGINAQEGNPVIIGSNLISAEAAKIQAEKEGFNAEVLTTLLQGEAVEVGRNLGKMLRERDFTQYAIRNFSSPFCLIFGGETTVTLNGASGRGGRNQELALAAVEELADLPNVMLITLATDGEDGPTDAAGAVVTGETLSRAKKLGLDVESHLRSHDAYPFFDALGDLFKIGATGTNVNDLTFLLLE